MTLSPEGFMFPVPYSSPRERPATSGPQGLRHSETKRLRIQNIQEAYRHTYPAGAELVTCVNTCRCFISEVFLARILSCQTLKLYFNEKYQLFYQVSLLLSIDYLKFYISKNPVIKTSIKFGPQVE